MRALAATLLALVVACAPPDDEGGVAAPTARTSAPGDVATASTGRSVGQSCTSSAACASGICIDGSCRAACALDRARSCAFGLCVLSAQTDQPYCDRALGAKQGDDDGQLLRAGQALVGDFSDPDDVDHVVLHIADPGVVAVILDPLGESVPTGQLLDQWGQAQLTLGNGTVIDNKRLYVRSTPSYLHVVLRSATRTLGRYRLRLQ